MAAAKTKNPNRKPDPAPALELSTDIEAQTVVIHHDGKPYTYILADEATASLPTLFRVLGMRTSMGELLSKAADGTMDDADADAFAAGLRRMVSLILEPVDPNTPPEALDTLRDNQRLRIVQAFKFIRPPADQPAPDPAAAPDTIS